ncbi:hypothetical protein [Dactylosporangium sp. CA-092794]|uniref:hypothetical protein n=1 Tax=Dactylosporangium sp. CA-092794 TaxID=3239929 RepID=UPI003D921B2E
MRNRHESGGLSGRLAEVLEFSRLALEHVTVALCDESPTAPGALPGAGTAMHALRLAVSDQAMAIRATRVRQSATSLPSVVAAAQVNADAAGLAAMVRRLAEIAASRPSRPMMPADVRAIVCRTGRACVEMMTMAAAVARPPQRIAEAAICARGAEMDQLRRRLHQLLLREPDSVDVDAALDASLACGYYRRCGDLAASMAEHAVLAAAGEPVRRGERALC